MTPFGCIPHLASQPLPPSFPQLIFHLLTDSLWIPGDHATSLADLNSVCDLSKFSIFLSGTSSLPYVCLPILQKQKSSKLNFPVSMQPRFWMWIRFYILDALEWALKDRSKFLEEIRPRKCQIFVQYCFEMWRSICWGDSSQTPLVAFHQ